MQQQTAMDNSAEQQRTRRSLVTRALASIAAATAAVSVVNSQGAAAQTQWQPQYDERDRFLRRLTYGVNASSPQLNTPQEFGWYVQAQTAWNPSVNTPLEQQIAAQLPLTQRTMSSLVADYRTGGSGNVERQLAAATAMRRIFSEGQLYELMVQFWQEHFNFPSQFQGYVSRIAVLGHDRAIRPHALGTFSDLLVNVVENPSLIIYLNNHQSRAGALNENFGRELLELYTMGEVDASGNRNYTEAEVRDSAKVMTGWSSKWLDGSWTGEFVFRENWHDTTVGTSDPVVGWSRPGGTDYLEHGRSYLRHLASHPKTAEFVCRKIAHYFLGDEVPDRVVEEMAQTWWLFGSAIGPVLATLLGSPEFKASLQVSDWQRPIRRPMDHVIACIRALNPDLSDCRGDLLYGIDFRELMATRHLDHRWPAPNGYPISSAYWRTPSGMANRMYMSAVLGSGVHPLCDWDPTDLLDGAVEGDTAMAGSALASALAVALLGQDPHPRLLDVLTEIVAGRTATALTADLDSIRDLAVLCFSSPQFQVR